MPEKYYYKTRIQYDGTGYAGLQWQKDLTTIQNDFNQAIKTLVAGKVTTMSASRTDTGVHAIEQIIKITSESMIECSSFLIPFNQKLPSQIRCLEILPCSGDFKPASDPVSKEYRYYFTNKRITSSDERRFISNFSKQLNLDDMKFCVQAIVGTHNFGNFCSTGSNVKSTVRNITLCELTEIDPRTIFKKSEIFSIPQDLKSCYQLQIKGNGFLKQMIRHLVSALWMVGSGKLTTSEFMTLLSGPKKEKRIWKVAPPNGLFLYEITY